MSDRTPFADLTRLAPQDPLSADGFGLQVRNPTLMDYFLRLLWEGTRDGHDALADPALDPVLAVDAALGQIPSDLTITVGYTLLDADGGETALSPLVDIDTAASLQPPDFGPSVALDHVAGTLMAGSYDYAITLTDGNGGETELSPIATILIPSGNPVNEIVVTDMGTLATGMGAAGWRLWRSINDEDFHLIGQGDAATDAFTDDGSHAADCGVTPPTTSANTNSTSQLSVTVPGGQPADAVNFNIYATTTGSFTGASLLGTYPIADVDTAKLFDTLTFTASSPPETSTTMPALPGGGGGGLFTYPQDWDFGSFDVATTGGTNQREFSHIVVGTPDGSTPNVQRTLLYDGPGEFDWTDAMKFRHSSSGLNDPAWSEIVNFFAADAPGMRDGHVTVKFKLPVMDADTAGAVWAYIGHQFGPRVYARAYIGGGDGHVELSAGVADVLNDDTYDDVPGGVSTAPGVVVVDTDYWLRVTRSGIQAGADLYDEDPDVNPAAVPVATVPLADQYQAFYDWDFRVNCLPGFGWDYWDASDRDGILAITGLKSHAETGGDGYKPLDSPRVLVMESGGTMGNGPVRAINFQNFNVTDERPDRDYVTIALPGLHGIGGSEFNFALALDPTYSGMVEENMALYHPAADYLGVRASAAGDDGRMVSDVPYRNTGGSQKTAVQLIGVAADDKFGVIVRGIDLDNFLLARVDNATAAPKLELVKMVADAETVLMSVDITQVTNGVSDNPWDVADPLWLVTEFTAYNSSWSVALYDMDPDQSIAKPRDTAYTRLVGADVAAYSSLVSGWGLQLAPDAGGTNTLRAASLRWDGD